MMSTPVEVAPISYPQSDGQRMAENTTQFRCIVTIQGGLDALFRHHPQVFVAGDLLWYAVEGQPEICTAPDVMVVFGRPKGDRGSYLQWEEDGIAPQVVFEILSPGNTPAGMMRKFRFYERYRVEEYYLYNPDTEDLRGWRRQGVLLEEIASMQGWLSPRLGVRFAFDRGRLQLYHPDGEPFLTYVELMEQHEQEHQRAEQEHQRAEQEHQRAEQEHQRAEQEHQRAEQERQRAERLAAQLRDLGVDPEEA